MLARLAHVVSRHRRKVIFAWVALTLFGAFSASQVSKRWYQSFSIPGKSAYEANQRTLKTFGTGIRPPDVVVFHTAGDATKSTAIAAAMRRAAAAVPRSRTSSYFSTHDLMYVSKDRHTTFEEVYPPGPSTFSTTSGAKDVRAAAERGLPSGVQVEVTGHDPLEEASSQGGGSGNVLVEAVIGGLGAIVILLFVFGTLPAVLMPVAVAVGAILNTFTLVWALTYITNVSIIVQYLIALVGLGVAIDYALLMIFRFRDELREGEDVETALVETMTHAGRSVIVSGSTVAVGLLSMVLLPLPFIRSIGIGGMLIPAVSVLASITLLPSMLAMLGPRINRGRVMPKRLVEGSDQASGFWAWWSRLVTNHAALTGAIGVVVVAALLVPGVQLNPSESQAKDRPGGGDAIAGRAALSSAGISAGVYKPFDILVEGPVTRPALEKIAAGVAKDPGVAGAVAPTDWQRGDAAVVEAISAEDGAAPATKTTISRLQHDVLPKLADDTTLKVTLGGSAAADRDFVHAVYGNFPYVLLFVIVLTYILLARAFRSLILPLKAVILNLVSLGAAYGIIVFIFQWGHGSEAIWNVPATNSIIPWIPLMIFAFLYGLSMDYEAFMITHIREAHDDGDPTPDAIPHGLGRTGKLVTGAARVLAMAFLVLSTSPGTDIKQFGIGLAAGVIFDATVIRALLVPSLMQLLGDWNWIFPGWAARALFVERRPQPAETPAEAGAPS